MSSPLRLSAVLLLKQGDVVEVIAGRMRFGRVVCLAKVPGVGIGWQRRWGAQPVWVRCALVVYVVGFAVGTCAHVVDLVRGGFGVYASFGPVVLQVFFISLVVLDPIVVVLVALARPSGVWLGLVVMAMDVPANVLVNWPMLRQDWWLLVRPGGLLFLTLFGVFVLVSVVPLSRCLSAS
jgi:hypothetical protein